MIGCRNISRMSISYWKNLIKRNTINKIINVSFYKEQDNVNHEIMLKRFVCYVDLVLICKLFRSIKIISLSLVLSLFIRFISGDGLVWQYYRYETIKSVISPLPLSCFSRVGNIMMGVDCLCLINQKMDFLTGFMFK